MASTPGFEPGPHWWEANALTTAPSLAPIFAAKHSWTILRMSSPLFVGHYLQVTWHGGLSANEKEEKFASNDNPEYPFD